MGIETTLNAAIRNVKKATAEVEKGDVSRVATVAGHLINIQEDVQRIAVEYVGHKKKWKKQAKDAHKLMLTAESEVRKLDSEKKRRQRSLNDLKSLVERGGDQKKLVKKYEDLKKQHDKYMEKAAKADKIMSLIRWKFGDDIKDWYVK